MQVLIQAQAVAVQTTELAAQAVMEQPAGSAAMVD
jgi:hypothetical protein